jgi:serine/threonine protein kinase
MNNILAGSVKYPETMSTHLKDLISSLLSVNPFGRLGCMHGGIDEVLTHEFFGEFDWKGLLNKKMPVPYKPALPSNVETMGKKDSAGMGDRAAKVNWIANLGQNASSRFMFWMPVQGSSPSFNLKL